MRLVDLLMPTAIFDRKVSLRILDIDRNRPRWRMAHQLHADVCAVSYGVAPNQHHIIQVLHEDVEMPQLSLIALNQNERMMVAIARPQEVADILDLVGNP